MRIARDVALRIDRLSRRAHRFHRHAHHPLCGAYHGELIALGRKARVCRGCALLVFGLALGAALGLLLPIARAAPATVFVGALALACAAAAAAAFGLRAAAGAHSRPGKLWTRLLPAAGLAGVAGVALRLPLGPSALLLLLVAGAFAGLYRVYRGRGPDRAACQRCPERTRPVCSGFAPIVQRERAVQRIARGWITRAG